MSFFAFSKYCSILQDILARLGIFAVGVGEDGDEKGDHHYANYNAYYYDQVIICVKRNTIYKWIRQLQLLGMLPEWSQLKNYSIFKQAEAGLLFCESKTTLIFHYQAYKAYQSVDVYSALQAKIETN